MATSREVTTRASRLRVGDVISNHCIFGTVVVEEVLKPGFYLLARKNGSQFTSTIPDDSPILILWS